MKLFFDLGSNDARAQGAERIGMVAGRWIAGLGALLVAAIALYLVLTGTKESEWTSMPEMSSPALDEIDAKSRSAMRDLLRETENEE